MKRLFAAVAAASVALAPAAWAQPVPAGVETGLIGAVTLDGKISTYSLPERMQRWNTPAISIAIVSGGRIEWAGAYGVLESGKPAKATPRTRFQAASISKPVAAATALSLVEQGRLSLDADINTFLKRWQVPAHAFATTLTLRHLLSHTGGTTVHGFPGYAQGAPVPTVVQILKGEAPANTKPVVVDQEPGKAWRYSGGGTTIVQLAIEDVTDKSFAEVATERVLKPTGMADSGYGPQAAGSFTLGHDIKGAAIPTGWHSYPEAAAAGLWTTPSDLARFGLAIRAAWKGDAGGFLKPDTVRMMLTPVMGGYGLGPGVEGEGAAFRFSHGGANEGFRAMWIVYPETGDGIVVMTNSESGDRVMFEVIRGVAKARGWAGYAPAAYAIHALADTELQARTGVWRAEADGMTIDVTVRREGDGLALDTFRGTYVMRPISATEVVAVDTGSKAAFVRDEAGQPVLKAFGLTLKRVG